MWTVQISADLRSMHLCTGRDGPERAMNDDTVRVPTVVANTQGRTARVESQGNSSYLEGWPPRINCLRVESPRK
jgi:hypothetical protein